MAASGESEWTSGREDGDFVILSVEGEREARHRSERPPPTPPFSSRLCDRILHALYLVLVIGQSYLIESAVILCRPKLCCSG